MDYQEYDDDFAGDARLDELSDLQELAEERGFENIDEMNEYDREMESQRSDYYGGLGV